MESVKIELTREDLINIIYALSVVETSGIDAEKENAKKTMAKIPYNMGDLLADMHDIAIVERYKFIREYIRKQGLINIMGSFFNENFVDKLKEVEKLDQEHRYLQNEIFDFIVALIVKYASNYDKNFFDERNETACRCAAMIRNLAMEKVGNRYFVKEN